MLGGTSEARRATFLRVLFERRGGNLGHFPHEPRTQPRALRSTRRRASMGVVQEEHHGLPPGSQALLMNRSWRREIDQNYLFFFIL